MEERQLCCCGFRGWTLVIAWFEIIVGIWAFHDLGKIFLVLLESMKPDKDSHDEEKLFSLAVLVQLGMSVMLRILEIVGVSIAVILIRGCKNKNPKQLHFWIIYAKILLAIVVVALIVELFLSSVELVPSKILCLCIEVAVQGFCIWVVGIHKMEIEASSVTVVDYKA